MNLRRCLLLFIVASLTAGCASPRQAPRTTQAPAATPAASVIDLPLTPDDTQRLGYRTRWISGIPLEPGQTIHAAKVLGDLLVCVERPNNVVTAIDLTYGNVAWKEIVGEKLDQLYTPVGDEDHVYVNSGNRLFTLDRNRGKVIDTSNLQYPVDSAPLLTNNLAVFGSVNGIVFAHRVTDGHKRWAYALESRVATPAILDNRQLFIADSTGHYAMLEAATGTLRWRGETFGPVTAAPLRDRSFILVASEDQSLYGLVATTGRDRWPAYRSEAPFTRDPVVLGNTIYLSQPDVGLTALDANTAEPRWTADLNHLPLSLTDGVLMTNDGLSLTKVDPASGRTLAQVPTQPLQHVVPGPDDSLILVARSGELVRIAPQPKP